MATFIGTSAADVLGGTADDDTFDISQGGADNVSGAKGDDTFLIGAAFTAADRIDGATGNDTLVLDGDYSLSLAATSIVSIERIELRDGHDYALALHDENVTRDASLTVSAAALTTGALEFDASAETKGVLTVIGGARDDRFYGGSGGINNFDGGAGGDFFLAPDGSTGIFDGGQGDDTVVSSGLYTLRGGDGFDFLVIPEHFDAVLKPAEWGFEVLQLDRELIGTDGDDHWDFSGVIVSGEPIIVGMDGDDVMIGADDHFNRFYGLAGNDRLYGGNDTDEMTGGSGKNKLFGGGGDDFLGNFDVLSDGPGRTLLDGGDGNDFLLANDGQYRVFGGEGDDRIGVENAVVRQDTLFGGNGIDTLVLEFDGAVFDVDLLNAETTGIENVQFDGDVAGSERPNTLDFSGFTVIGNAGVTVDGRGGNDVLIGTDRSDTLLGGAGEDSLWGGLGADSFAYAVLTGPTGAAGDTIEDFNLGEGDTIELWFDVNAVAAPVEGGTLSNVLFDADLALAIGASELGAHEALIFTPDAGALGGLTFLVVDANGNPGYQAGEDFVVEIAGGDLSGLDADDFT